MSSALDVHAHYYPRQYVEVVRRVAGEKGAHAEVARAFLEHRIINKVPTFLDGLEERLSLMDTAGIQTQVLSFASLNIWHPDPETRVELTWAYNDGLAEVVGNYPERFRFLASLPFPFVDESVAEARRARTLAGWVGFSIPTHINTVPINDHTFEPVYSSMAEEQCLVLAHPDGFCSPNALSDFGMEWAIGAPFEDTIVAVRLLASGLVDKYPSLRWVIPHLGGTLPFLLHRLLWRWELEAKLLGTTAHHADALNRMLFETANCSEHTLALAEKVLPADSIVFGTDFPFVDSDNLVRPVQIVEESPNSQSILSSRLAPYLFPFSQNTPMKGNSP